MAEPTSIITCEDLLTRIAREAGIAYHGSAGDEKAMPPLDVHDLELCKEIMNDGIRMFITDAPRTGWRWRRRIMSVPITGTRITGTADSTSTTTIVDADLCEALGTMAAEAGTNATTLVDATLTASYPIDDELIGYYCYIIGGTGAGSYAKITDYDASTGTITVADWLTAGGLPGGTDPVSTDTFGISAYKIEVGYYCYITAGTGKGSWAVVTGWNSSNGTVTVADWLDAYGNAAGTDPTVGSSLAITPIETVGGDIARYPLAENFGGEVNGSIKYEKDSSHSAIIEWRDESFIRARRATTVQSGYPQYAAVRPLEPVTEAIDPKRRYELILDPEPTTDEVLGFPYILIFDKLDMETGLGDSGSNTTMLDGERTEGDEYFTGWKCTIISGTGKGSHAIVTSYTGSSGTFNVDDWLKAGGVLGGGTNPGLNSVYKVEPVNNLHPAGVKYDQAILSACLAQAELKIEDITGNFIGKYEKKDLMVAHQTDARSAPRKLGSMNTRKCEHRHRYWNDVTYN